MSESKKYAIVSFINEAQVDVVPSSWLVGENQVRWPKKASLYSIMRFIREFRAPKDDWENIDVRILGFANSFKSANRLADLAQETPNLETDSSQSETEGRRARKRRRPLRFEDSALSFEDSSEEDIYVRKEIPKKRFPIPPTPTMKDQTSTSSLSDTSTSLMVSNKDPPSVSLIGPELSQTPTLPDENIVVTLFTRMFESLDQIKNDLRCLKDEQTKLKDTVMECIQSNGPIQGLVTLPRGINLPVQTDVQLVQLNISMREDESLKSTLVRYLHGSCTGKTISLFILSVTKRLMDQSVASCYSRLGRKGKKSFQALEELYNAVLATAALKFPEAEKEELAEKFGRVLASAPEWEGNRKVGTRKSTVEISSTDTCIVKLER